MLAVLAPLVLAAVSAGSPSFTIVSTTIEPLQSMPGTPFFAPLACVDVDEDGRLDVIVGRGNLPDQLYRGLPGPDLTFAPLPAWLPGQAAHTIALAAHDFTGDGHVDLLRIHAPADSNAMRLVSLLEWTPAGYVDASTTRLEVPRAAYVGAAVGDPDGDGDLDVALLRWAQGLSVQQSDCLSPHFLENDGGILRWSPDALPGAGCGLVGTWADLDGDGDVDWLQVNDFGMMVHPNVVLRNDGVAQGAPGSLARWKAGPDIAPALGLATPLFGMGVSIGDVNQDGRLDLFQTSYGEDALLLGQDGGTWTDATDAFHVGGALGIAGPRFKWGTALFDADLDGRLDLMVTTGVIGEVLGLTSEVGQSIFYHGQPGPTLVEASKPAGLNLGSDDRTVVPCDFNDDGRVDLLVGGPTELTVLRNVTPSPGHFLSVRLKSTVSNRDGLGATLSAIACGQTWTGQHPGGATPGGTADPRWIVGLGDCAGPASVTVVWPSGYKKTSPVPVDTTTTLSEPAWVTVAPKQLAHGGAPATVVLSWSGTPPVVTAAPGGPIALVEAGPDTWTGVVPMPPMPGDVVLSFTVEGQVLPHHPRVRVRTAPALEVVVSPAMPYRSMGATVVVLATDGTVAKPGQGFTLELAGGEILEKHLDTAGASTRYVISVDPLVSELTLTPSTGPSGAAQPFLRPVLERVDGATTGVRVTPVTGSGPPAWKVAITPRDANRTTSPMDSVGPGLTTLPVEVRVDGNPVPLLSPVSGNGQLVVTTVAASAVPNGAVLTARADGVAIDQSARPGGSEPLSPKRSAMFFYGRHLHADGQDLLPLRLLAHDALGQPLPDQKGALSFVATGCEVLADTLTSHVFEDTVNYGVFVRSPLTPGTCSVSLLVNGGPAGLTAVCPVVPAVPPPAPATIDLVTTAPGDVSKPIGQIPGDGTTQLDLVARPRDVSGNLLGPGFAVTVDAPGFWSGPVRYVAFGAYATRLVAPVGSCLASLKVTLGTASQAVELLLHDGMGAPNLTACQGLTPPEPVPEPAPEPVPEPVIAEKPPLPPESVAAEPGPSAELPPRTGLDAGPLLEPASAVEPHGDELTEDDVAPGGTTIVRVTRGGCRSGAPPGGPRSVGLLLLLALLVAQRVRRGH